MEPLSLRLLSQLAYYDTKAFKQRHIVCSYRHIVVASVALAALGTLPVLVPDVVTERHVTVDLTLALLCGRTLLGHVVLFLSTLKKINKCN